MFIYTHIHRCIHLYVLLSICICTYTNAYVSISVRVIIRSYKNTNTYSNRNKITYANLCIHKYTCMDACIGICVHMHAYAQARTHTNTHTHTHAHTHPCS